jgi:hypothetical protein
VTGITPGVVTIITVGGITVIAGCVGAGVSCNFTAGEAEGDPKALINKPVRIKIENKTVFSFILTPFGVIGAIEISSALSSITRRLLPCYPSPIARTFALAMD